MFPCKHKLPSIAYDGKALGSPVCKEQEGMRVTITMVVGTSIRVVAIQAYAVR